MPGFKPQVFKSFSQSLELFFLTVGQNNFGNKIPKFNDLEDLAKLPKLTKIMNW